VAPSRPSPPSERGSGGDIVLGIGGIDIFAGQLASRSAAALELLVAELVIVEQR
jgi:hypothetical protein